MALVFAERVQETTTSTGTGNISLGGVPSSPAGRVTFVTGVGNANLCKYLIDDNAGNWEIGVGTVTSGAPDTLSRDRIIDSSNGGSIVNFTSGQKDVKAIVTGEDIPGQSAFFAPGGAAATDATGDDTIVTVDFGSETTDVGDDYNSGTSTFTAPFAGIYQFHSTVIYSAPTADWTTGHDIATLHFFLNGTTEFGGVIFHPNNERDTDGTVGSITRSLSAIRVLAASDTVVVRGRVGNSTKVIDVTGSDFAGYLVSRTG